MGSSPFNLRHSDCSLLGARYRPDMEQALPHAVLCKSSQEYEAGIMNPLFIERETEIGQITSSCDTANPWQG